jgi:hypothetical protein
MSGSTPSKFRERSPGSKKSGSTEINSMAGMPDFKLK